jgi:hypothetical protein
MQYTTNTRKIEAAACMAALAQYIDALVSVLLEADLSDVLRDEEEIWENLTVMMPQASATGYLHAPAVCLEVSDLDLHGNQFEWRGRSFPVDVPSGFRAISPHPYIVQIVTEDEAAQLERDRAPGTSCFSIPTRGKSVNSMTYSGPRHSVGRFA